MLNIIAWCIFDLGIALCKSVSVLSSRLWCLCAVFSAHHCIMINTDVSIRRKYIELANDSGAFLTVLLGIIFINMKSRLCIQRVIRHVLH